MKARIISFGEVEERIREIVLELERRPIGEKAVLQKASELSFILGLCISQMKAIDASYYPEKNKQLKILQTASEAITYKINTCTIEEAEVQVNKAYRAFGAQ
jgi:hypothetical protein